MVLNWINTIKENKYIEILLVAFISYNQLMCQNTNLNCLDIECL